MKKRIGLLATVIVLCLAIVAGATFALLSATDRANNVFVKNTNPTEPDANKVKIDLIEPLWDSTGSSMARDYLPGDSIPKNPQIKNIGGRDAYVAVVIRGNTVTAQGVPVPGAKTLADLKLIADITFNPDGGWTETQLVAAYKTTINDQSAVAYIYNTRLAGRGVGTAYNPTGGAVTTAVFKTVDIKRGIGDADLIDIDLQIDAYGVQADNVTSAIAGLKEQWPNIFA